MKQPSITNVYSAVKHSKKKITDDFSINPDLLKPSSQTKSKNEVEIINSQDIVLKSTACSTKKSLQSVAPLSQTRSKLRLKMAELNSKKLVQGERIDIGKLLGQDVPEQENIPVNPRKRKLEDLDENIQTDIKAQSDSRKRVKQASSTVDLIKPSSSQTSIQSKGKSPKVLSKESQSIIQRVLQNSKVVRPSQPSSQNTKKKSRSPNRLDDEDSIPFSQLALGTPKFAPTPTGSKTRKMTRTETLQKAEVKPILSESTLSIISKLQKKRGRDSRKKDPSPGQMSSDQNVSMSFKHSDLLKTTVELPLPLHYKVLIDISRFIDEAIAFIRTRSRGDQKTIWFTEVQDAIAKGQARRLDQDQFRQLLSVVPEFYSHSWEALPGRRGFALAVNLPLSDIQIHQVSTFQQRRNTLKERMTEQCVKIYREFCQTEKSDKTRDISPASRRLLDKDPRETRMWHHSFDPHTEIPKISLADLKLQPQVTESISVRQYLNRAVPKDKKSLIDEALDRTRNEIEEEKQQDQEQQRRGGIRLPSSNAQLQLEAQSRTTGLSIETLKLLKAKESAVKEHKAQLNRSLLVQEDSKKLQQLQICADKIRQTMLFKNKTTMTLLELSNAITSTAQSTFISAVDQEKHILEVIKLVPEWLTLKVLPGRGRIVKMNKSVDAFNVKRMIATRLKQ